MQKSPHYENGYDLDETDKRILRVVQIDSSQTTAQIADAVGLSQAPCWRRLQKLKDEGYIRAEVALLDRRKVGLNAQVFAQVKLTATGRSNVDDFTDAIREFPEVLECFVLLGTVDFLLRIVARDIEACERFL